MSSAWQTRPIFISSTFKDMHAERDWLQHHVFPRLEEELLKRRVHLEPIDLRLGVETAQAGSEEARELMVLKVCLDEIQRSRPFLLVFLGDRYGWVPPVERMEVAAREQGFDTAVADKSVTALEIEFGIFRQDPEQKQRSLFFFRRPLPSDTMPAQTAADYSDTHSPDPAVRVGHARLAALKERLLKDPATRPRVFEYAAGWDASAYKVIGLQAFGDSVFERLWAELDDTTAQLAQQAPTTWQEHERAEIVEFCEHRARNFVGRETLIDELLHLATAPAAPDSPRGACVIGQPGAGKSALFARLYLRLSGSDDILLLANAAGGTPRGSQVNTLLLRWIDELSQHLHISNPLPENPSQDDLDNTLLSLLHRASAQKRVVLLLDALDQLEATNRGRHLTWLRNKQWPANAKLIATALESDPAQALYQWDHIRKIDLPLLAAADAAEIGRQVWQRYHRTLSPQVLQGLTSKTLPDNTPACGNPLWLTLALEQLNLLDADDFVRAERDYTGTPTERMHALILDTAAQMPPDIPGLYGWLLSRNEKAFGKALTRAFAVAVALSRFGWREQDLIDLVPRLSPLLVPDAPCHALDELTLATLRRGFRAHMLRRGEMGQLDFYHLQMRDALEQAYLQDQGLVSVLHSRISDYLESIANDPLIRIERMRHLIGERNSLRAARYFAGLEPSQSSPFEERIGSSWSLVEWIVAEEMASKNKDNGTANPSLAWILTWLEQKELSQHELYRLTYNIQFGLLEKLENAVGLDPRRILMEHTRAALQQLAKADPSNACWLRDLAANHEKVGNVLGNLGNLSGALNAYRQSMAIRHRLAKSDSSNAQWQRDLSVSHDRVGDVLLNQGDLTGAFSAYRKSLAIAQCLAESDPSNTGWQRDLWVSYWKIADMHEKSDLPEAMDWWEKAFDQLIGIKAKGLFLSPQDEAVLGQLKQRLAAQQKHEMDRLLAEGSRHVDAGNFTEAFSLSRQLEEMARKYGDVNFLQLAWNSLGCAYRGLGEIQKAMDLHKKQEALSRKHRLANGVAFALTNQAEILAGHLDRPAEALPLAKEALRIFRDLNMAYQVEQLLAFIQKLQPDGQEQLEEEEKMAADFITLENLSIEMLQSVYESAFMEPAMVQGYLQVKENSASCYVIPDKEMGRVLLMIVYAHKKGADRASVLEFVNSVNRQYILLRASVRDDGGIYFDHEFALAGGLSKKNLVLTTKRFMTIPAEAIKSLGKDLF